MNNILIFNITIVYLLLSFNEWYIHKNLMHDNDKNFIINFIDKIYFYFYKDDLRKDHINHHKYNNHDGSIDDDLGTIFSSSYKFLLPLILLIQYYSITKIFFNFSNNFYLKILFIFFIIAYIYEKLWNCFHLKFHRWNNTYNKDGIIENNFYYKYLEKYHMIHHYNKANNKFNYNIILPGMDYIMGTYKNCVDNTVFCKKNKNKSKKNYKLCTLQENNIKLPYNIDYCK